MKQAINPIPTFSLEDPAKVNFDKYNAFMRDVRTFDDVKRCRWTFEGYLKSCGVSEREYRRKLYDDGKETLKFHVEK